jgi:hypothetical protein
MTTDQHLDQSTLAQMTFKPGTVRRVAVAIASAAEASQGSLWADEVPLPELGPDDKNTIGLAFRNLARWKIIERCEGATDHRRSRRAGRKGGVCWRYVVVNRGLLRAFLKANGASDRITAEKQIELF